MGEHGVPEIVSREHRITTTLIHSQVYTGASTVKGVRVGVRVRLGLGLGFG